MSERPRPVFPVIGGRPVDNTAIPCPLCAAEGNQTITRTTPTLRKIHEGDGRLFCIGSHGYITDDEMSTR